METQVKNSSLMPGTRLEKIGPPGRVWIVVRLVDGIGQMPHAVIASEVDRDDTRLLSQSVLTDKSCYRKLASLKPD